MKMTVEFELRHPTFNDDQLRYLLLHSLTANYGDGQLPAVCNLRVCESDLEASGRVTGNQPEPADGYWYPSFHMEAVPRCKQGADL